MNRKKFIKSLLVIGGVGAITGLYTWQIEPFWLEFVHQNMPIKNLPDELVGKTLLQISDIHVGNQFPRQYLIDSFAKAQAFKPDFVVYTGDFVSYKTSEQFGQLAEVFQSVVTGSLATVGILGNHDYGKNWQEATVANQIVEILEGKGVEILRNVKKNCNCLGGIFSVKKAKKTFEKRNKT